MKKSLLYTRSVQKAKTEIEGLRGRIILYCTPAIIIALLPDQIDVDALTEATVNIPESLDAISSYFIAGWNLPAPVKEIKIVPWNEPGYQHPRNADNDPVLGAEFKELPSGTSDYLIGSVAVGLTIVSGPDPDLQFNDDEITNTMNQVRQGLQVLAEAEPPANVSFFLETMILSVDAQPLSDPCPAVYEPCEAVWRNPALVELGCVIDQAGIDEYNEKLRKADGTDWAYTAFFTKYPLTHFAYTRPGRTVMQYSNDGWGSDQIDRVFAHETGHIFGAADEYRQTGSFGLRVFRRIPSSNDSCRSWPPFLPVRIL
jgi:hypothetical protein